MLSSYAFRLLLAHWVIWWGNSGRRFSLRLFPSWRRGCALTRVMSDRVSASALVRSWSLQAKMRWVSTAGRWCYLDVTTCTLSILLKFTFLNCVSTCLSKLLRSALNLSCRSDGFPTTGPCLLWVTGPNGQESLMWPTGGGPRGCCQDLWAAPRNHRSPGTGWHSAHSSQTASEEAKTWIDSAIKKVKENICYNNLNFFFQDDEETAGFALDGLKQVMAVKSRSVLPYLVPKVCYKFLFMSKALCLWLTKADLSFHSTSSQRHLWTPVCWPSSLLWQVTLWHDT